MKKCAWQKHSNLHTYIYVIPVVNGVIVQMAFSVPKGNSKQLSSEKAWTKASKIVGVISFLY
jgi:hypothetical protein